MNYNDKKKDNIEIDDMKIKSHLNASLDLSGINVSEDLINRTLEAIKKQSAEQTDTVTEVNTREVQKKVIPWNRYIRGFAGVAAAALIVVAGYGMISRGLTGSMKSDDSTNSAAQEERVNYDTAVSDTAEDFTYSASEAAPADDTLMAKDSGTKSADQNADGGSDNKADGQLAEQFTITADADMTSEGGGTTGSAGQTVPGEAATAEQPLQSALSVPVLTFRDIFLPDPAQAQSLTITDETTAATVTLTSQEEILDFYSVMDKHQFTSSSDSSAGSDYKVEIKSLQPGESQYTMTVGNNVIISYQDSIAASQSIYNATDSALLLQDLKDFFSKYNK